MAHEEITECVVDCLREEILDIQESKEGDLISHENVVLMHSTGLDVDGNHEINCYLRIMTADGPGPKANTWVLYPDFWKLWDESPTLCWLMDKNTFIQICGMIYGVTVTVNLWNQKPR